MIFAVQNSMSAIVAVVALTVSLSVSLASAEETDPCGQLLTVDGVILSTSGPPLSRIPVTLAPFGFNGTTSRVASESDGRFSLSAKPGWYYLYTSPCDGEVCTEYVRSTYPSSGEPFELTSDLHLSLVLSRSSLSVAGRVVDSQSGAPLSNAVVTVFGGEHDGSAITNSAGDFTIRGLPAGEYQVFASRPPTHFAAALPGSVTINSDLPTAAVAVGLVPASTLVGRVVNTSGAPVRSFSVEVTNIQTARFEGFFNVEGEDGSFRVGPVPVGEHRVRIRSSRYLFTYVGDVVLAPDARPVVTNAGQETDVGRVTVFEGGIIRGQIAIAGTPFCMSGFRLYVDSGRTDTRTVDIEADGSFEVAGLPLDSYTLKLADDFDDRNEMLPHCFGGNRDIGYLGCQTVVANPADRAQPVIYGVESADAPTSGYINGKVVDSETGLPLSGATLWTYKQGDFDYFFTNFRTNPRGEFRLAGLPGCYFLELLNPGEYIGGYYPDFSSRPLLPVCITAGQGVNVTVAAKKGGSISGHVRDAATGQPVVGIEIVVWTADQLNVVSRYHYSGSDGSYRIAGLASGAFTIIASGVGPYLDSRYPTVVSVSGRQEVAGIDLNLVGGAAICGTLVYAGSSSPVSGATIIAAPKSLQYAGRFGQVGRDGKFCVSGLEAGIYTLRVEGDPRFPTQFYGGTNSEADATTISLSPGQTVKDITMAVRSYRRRAAGR